MSRRLGLSVLLALFGASAGWTAGTARAAVLDYCTPPAALNATQNDRLFRVAAIIRAELDASGQTLAIVSRSGLDLSRFGIRYSHAGVSLKANPSNSWAIRQLYYDCEAQKPRIFDQGVAAFLLGLSSTSIGYLSAVFVPPAQAQSLEAAALDNRQALNLLNDRYSANAFAFGLQYQNCNQWLAELMAAAWSRPSAKATLSTQATQATQATESTEAARSTQSSQSTQSTQSIITRLQAQTWLRERGYTPTLFEIAWRPMLWIASLIPWVHLDDHPPEDLEQSRLRVSMPQSIEAFLRANAPGSLRIEFCHTETKLVIRRGWQPILDGCQAESQDQVISLE